MSSWRLYLLTVINIFNYLDRYVVNAVLPLIAVEFSLSHTQEGQVASAFVIGYVLSSPVFGYLGDRFRRPILMCVGVLVWSIATVLSGAASGLALLIGARIMVGTGEASFGVIAPGYLKDFESDPIKLNKKLALFYVAIPVGSALAYVLGGAIAEAYSWRHAFYIAAALPVILSLFLINFPEKKNRTAPPQFNLTAIIELIRLPVLRYAQLGYIFNTFALTSIAAFIPSYGVSLGFSLEKINGIFGMILVGTGIGGTALGAYISSRFAKNSRSPIEGLLTFCGGGSLLAVPILIAAFVVESKILFLFFAGVAELLIFASLAPINTVLVLSAPAGAVTLTQGFTILLINVFGAFIGPQMVGYAGDKVGLALGLQLTSIAMGICSVLWLVGAKRALPTSQDNESENQSE